MIDLIERIGPYLGIAAFLGLAILAFLIFQQAREVRRLREWAGRAPERAGEAAEASLAAAEARGEATAAEAEAGGPGRVSAFFDRIRSAAAPAWAAVDRNSPVDPRYLLALLLAGMIAAGVLTSGFGLIGGDAGNGGGGGKGKAAKREQKPEVAVLNATQTEENGIVIRGIAGLAGKVAEQVVEEAGYEPGERTDAKSGAEETVVMFDEVGDEEAANRFAGKIVEQLGETPVAPMTQEVRDRADGAPLALVVGADDAAF